MSNIGAAESVKEPKLKRVVAFIDGQNLYRHVMAAFGASHPNYDVMALAQRICLDQGWILKQVRFYTGTPEKAQDQHWHNFWSKKLLAMGRQGVHVFSRKLRYREKEVVIDGIKRTIPTAEEKGIDVRIALDTLSLGLRDEYDVALIFSQDQDLSEVADELKTLSRMQSRWIKIASAYPSSSSASNPRGINHTQWIPFDNMLYAQCIDKHDYR
jgi:uncharacterized LabA/DUF88 family protein